MRKFVAIFVLLLVCPSAFSQVKIKKEHRVENRDPGYCAWACTEMLGRHLGIEALYNLMDRRSKEFTWEYDEETQKWYKSPYIWVSYGSYQQREHRSPASHQALSNKLNSLKIKYHYQFYYNYDKAIIKKAINNKKGCLVIVKYWLDDKGKPVLPSNNSTHAIIVLDYNDSGVEILDPNDIKRTYIATHEWFDTYWTGYVLVIDK